MVLAGCVGGPLPISFFFVFLQFRFLFFFPYERINCWYEVGGSPYVPRSLLSFLSFPLALMCGNPTVVGPMHLRNK